MAKIRSFFLWLYDLLGPTVFRFLVAGMLNALFGYFVFSFFIFCGVYYAYASLLSYFFGIIFNFNTMGRFVFGACHWHRIFRFCGVYVFLYGLNVLFLTFFNFMGVNFYLSGALVIPPLALISFFLNKYFVFKVSK